MTLPGSTYSPLILKIAHWADEFSTDAFWGNACNNL